MGGRRKTIARADDKARHTNMQKNKFSPHRPPSESSSDTVLPEKPEIGVKSGNRSNSVVSSDIVPVYCCWQLCRLINLMSAASRDPDILTTHLGRNRFSDHWCGYNIYLCRERLKLISSLCSEYDSRTVVHRGFLKRGGSPQALSHHVTSCLPNRRYHPVWLQTESEPDQALQY